MRNVRHMLEYALVRALHGLFRLLPLDVASWLGGKIAQAIGPLLTKNRIADRNLQRAMPELSAEERVRITKGMWNNLGRVFAEMAYLPSNALYERLTVKGFGTHPPPEKPCLFISAHLGNWEILPGIAYQYGVPVTLVYRHANNPYVNAYMLRLRGVHVDLQIPKGQRGATKLIRALKQGMSFAILVDQKMNDGIEVPFFELPAMTAPAVAQLALNYDLPIILTRCRRVKGCHFIAELAPPLTLVKTGNKEADIETVMTEINQVIEGWVRETPEQWMWIHRRWGKE